MITYSYKEGYCLGKLVDRFVTKLLVRERDKRVDKDFERNNLLLY